MMRNIKSRRWFAEKSSSRNGEPEPPQPQEEITPSSGWAEDSNCHYLLLELPDFKQDEIKMQIEGPNRVKISGERKAGEKTIYFDKTYTVPDDSDLERTSLKLKGGVFTVTIPKRLPPPPTRPSVQEPIQEITSENKITEKEFGEFEKSLPEIEYLKKENDGEDEKFKDREQLQPEIGDFSHDSNQFNGAAKMICDSKNTIFMTLIAFCLGVLVSRKIGR